MSRHNYLQWSDSPRGRTLIENEARFLNQAITLSYTQYILQLGYLGWENKFIDCSCYRAFFVVDESPRYLQKCAGIQNHVTELAIASGSIDMIILPHLLEFSPHRQQILREIERALRPEGKLIILGFNPWSVFSLTQIYRRTLNRYDLLGKNKQDDRFISRSRMIDWLHRLNFEAEIVAGFNTNTVVTQAHDWQQNKNSFAVTAYAICAIKRQFNILPWQTDWIKSRKFTLANASTITNNSYHGNNLH